MWCIIKGVDMKELIIKKGDKTIYNGHDIYNVDVTLPIKEFHLKLLETCQNKLGMKFDHYMDEFYEFDNCIDNNDINDIVIENREYNDK